MAVILAKIKLHLCVEIEKALTIYITTYLTHKKQIKWTRRTRHSDRRSETYLH